MRRGITLTLIGFFAVAGIAVAAAKFDQAKPDEFDPAKTSLVQAAWLHGIGCPTDAKVSNDGSTTTPYTDAACPSGDAKDKKNEGLLLAKTGPTSNFAAAVATLKNVKGITVSELGFDLRKPDSEDGDRGSHCGAGAPRFNVTTSSGTQFIGCNSLVVTGPTSNGFIRLRYNGPAIANVQSISIVADEAEDTGPDNFGVSILDNIDVNGTLVGKGATDAS